MKRFILVNLLFIPMLLSMEAAALFKSKPITEITATQPYQYIISVEVPIYRLVDLTLLEAPKGMRLTKSQQLIWKPDYADAGRHKVVLQATDGERVENQEFTLVVHAKNRAPVIRSTPMKSVREGVQYYYRVDAVDPDGDALSIKFVNFPAAAKLSSDSITWQTDYGDEGGHQITIQVSDGKDVVEQSFTLQVHGVNRPPVFENADVTQFSLKENDPWKYRVNAVDPDGDTVKLSLYNAPEGMSLQGEEIVWRPNFDQSGQYYVNVIASDGKDEATLSLQLDVENVNRLPEITSAPVTEVRETDLYEYTVRAFDPDRTMLSYSLLEGPEGMELYGNRLVWQPDYGMAGSYPVKVEVSDGEGVGQQAFFVTVRDRNREPIIQSVPVTKLKEMDVFSYEFIAQDPDGDELKIEYDIPKQITRKGNHLYWQTDYNSAGSYPVTIRVSDKEVTLEQSFVIEVENVNQKPKFTSTPPTQANEAIYYEYQLEAEDLDGEELSYTLEKSPRGMHIKDGLLMWIPNFDQAGKHKVIATVTDGIDSDTQEFTIVVKDTNREPTIEDIQDQQIWVGERLRLQVEVDDLDGDKVSTRLINPPKGMSLNKKNELLWRPSQKDIGLFDIVIEASDGDLAVRSHFKLEVLSKE